MRAYEYEPKTEEERRQMEEVAAKAERGEHLDVVPGSVRHMDPNREVDEDQFFRDLHAEFEQMRLRRAEATQTARKTWKIRVPKDLDDKASQLAKQEGTNKSAIIRKAVAWYVQGTGKQQAVA
ncbi:ribbon-helix-helix protein, CopG family [Bifidobacterium sp. ESL0820]|uniref:ribbon-helix-helix protein, CopG family n=1 Tax=Bifidobacterium sp. ESL0820 TaxID=3448586 RepID=UPI00404101A9